MRRYLILSLLTVTCWGMAMACSGGGVPSSQTVTKNPTVDPGGSPLPPPGGGVNGGGVDFIVLPTPQISASLLGKSVIQDSNYGVGKLQAHATDSKNQPTEFHWMLTGPGIAAAVTGDGADFSYDLPAVADKSAYELLVIGTIAGKGVQEKLNFFTVPAATAAIVANVNQANGVPVQMADGGAVLKGKTIAFTADAKFATQYKWQLVKNGAATDLGTTNAATVTTKDLGQSQVTLQTAGEGGSSPVAAFNFVVSDNAVPVVVDGTVTKAAAKYSDTFKDQGKYPVGSLVTIDAAKMGKNLSSMKCNVFDAAMAPVAAMSQTATQSDFQFNTPGNYTVNCAFTLAADYVAQNPAALQLNAAFSILPPSKAVITVDGVPCDLNTPALLYAQGAGVTFSAANSSGNVTDYQWFASADGKYFDSFNAVGPAGAQYSLNLTDVATYNIVLGATGIGDNNSQTCVVKTKTKPAAVIAANSTILSGRSYVFNSFQQAHASLTAGAVTGFVWKLLDVSNQPVVPNKMTPDFDFQLLESGKLSLQLQPQDQTILGDTNFMTLYSKFGQVVLVSPVDFSGIQSVAMSTPSDHYFASPSAIFHKGADGRVVQVANIAAHPALPDTLFVRNADDVYLFAADGYWRYSYKTGWIFNPDVVGTTPQAIAGPTTGSRLYVVANARLFMGDVGSGTWNKIADGMRYVTAMGSNAYAAATSGTVDDPNVVSCTPDKCTPLKWKVKPAVAVTWRSVGASNLMVYLADVHGAIYAVQNDVVSKIGMLPAGNYGVAFSRPATVTYVISNHGGAYRLTPTSVSDYLPPSAVTTTHATGIDGRFLLWDSVQKNMLQMQPGKTETLVAQSSIATTDAACAPQRMWMLGDVAYVSVCTIPQGKPALYSVSSVGYSGAIASYPNLATPDPIVGITDDGVGGLLIVRSGNGNNYVQQLAAGANLPTGLKITLDAAENFVGASGKFFLTTKGIRLNDGKTYPSIYTTDPHYAWAVDDVIYFSYGADTRFGKYDNSTQTFTALGNVTAPEVIVAILVDPSKRAYALTANALYMSDGSKLTSVFTPKAALANAMASLNGHQMLISLKSKGLVLVDLDNKVAPLELNPDAAGAASMEVWGLGYNGTQFLLYGQNMLTHALYVHAFGAPQ